jgi:hypothetical protein
MNLRPSILDFKSLESFKILQLKFSNYDINIAEDNHLKDFKLVKYPDDIEIVIKISEIEDNKMKFYSNFLNPQIGRLSQYAIRELEEKIYKELKYKIPERKLFVLDKIDELNKIADFLDTSSFFDRLDIMEIIMQVSNVIDFLHDDDSLKIKDGTKSKIRLKLSRSEIIFLFVLLRQRKLIDHKYNGELGRLIENNFMYFNEREGVFKEINDANKLMGDFINVSKTTKTITKSLKELFSDEDFYELKP